MQRQHEPVHVFKIDDFGVKKYPSQSHILCFETGVYSNIVTLAVPLKLRIDRIRHLFEVKQLLYTNVAYTEHPMHRYRLSDEQLRRERT